MDIPLVSVTLQYMINFHKTLAAIFDIPLKYPRYFKVMGT